MSKREKKSKKQPTFILTSEQQRNVAKKWVRCIFYPLIVLCRPLISLFRRCWNFLKIRPDQMF